MENRKVNINRAKISTQEIKNRQDFKQIVTVIKHPPNPYWKTLGFWGVTGLASLAVFFVTKLFLNNLNENNAYDNKTTLTINESNDQLPDDTECIRPHFKTVNVPFETFAVQAGVEETLKLRDGSLIHIPKGALMADVGSTVTIKTRAFKDKSSAFIAGIPMDYDGAAFESAGMLEIRGEQNGESIYINPDEPIEVALSLYKDPSTFNFYALDDKSGLWENYPCDYQGALEANSGAKNSKALSKIKMDLEVVKAEVKEVELQLKNLKAPRKEAYNIPVDKSRNFKIDYIKSEFPELEAMGEVSFEALPNQSNYHAVVSEIWSDFNLEPITENIFLVTFSNSKGAEKIKVRPVLKGTELTQALAKYDAAKAEQLREEKALKAQRMKLEEQQKAKQAQIEAEITKLNAQDRAAEKAKNAKVDMKYQPSEALKTDVALNMNYAHFRATRFGVFNSDKSIEYPKPLERKVDFVAANKDPQKIKYTYVFNLKKDVRFSYGATLMNEIDQFGLGKGDNVVVVIYEDGDLAYGTASNRSLSSTNHKLVLEIIERAELDEDKIKQILREDRITA